MSYLRQTLAPDEEVYAFAKIHWMVYAPTIAWLIVSFLFALFHYTPLFNLLYPVQASVGMLASVFVIFGKWGLIGSLIMVLITGTKAFIFTQTAELALTSHRALAKFGFIRRHSTELRPDRLESVIVDQSIPGRIFNYGSVYLQGIGGSSMPIPYIAAPLEFRSQANYNQGRIDPNRSPV